MSEKRTTGPRVIGRSSGPRISVAQPATPPTQVQLGNDRALAGAREVHIEQLQPDPRQPRATMDPVRLAELARSIAAYGLLQPLVVRQEGLGRDGDMRYMVVAGGRRYAAILMALEQAGDDDLRRRLARVPVVVIDSDAAQQRIIQLIENLQREDLSPLEEARAFKELMQVQALSMGELAARLHRSQGYIDERLRLLRHEEIEAAVEAGIITKSAGAAIASVHSADLRHAWLERAARGETIRPREVYASKPERRRRVVGDDGASPPGGAGGPRAGQYASPGQAAAVDGSDAHHAGRHETVPRSGPGENPAPIVRTAAHVSRQEDLLAAALAAIGMPTAQALRDRWRTAGPGERRALAQAAVRTASRTERALAMRVLALGAELDVSCAVLLDLLRLDDTAP